MGGYERHPAPWGLDGIPPDFNGQLLDGGLGALRGADDERDRPRAGARGGRGREARQRPRGVHAGRRVHPRRDATCAASGSPPASARTGSPARAAWASSWPSGSSRASRAWTSGRWTRAASAPPTRARRTRWRARSRSTRPTTTSSTRATSAQAGRPLRVSPAYERLRELGAAFGEKSGWERANWFEPNAAARRRVAAPARLGGPPLVAGDRRRAPCLPRDGGALRRDVLRQARRRRSGRGRVPRVALRQPRRPRRRRGHLHADAQSARRDRVRLHGHPPRGGALPHRHRHGLRPARLRLDPRARSGRRLGARRGRHLALRVPRPLGPGRARAPAAADRRRPRQRGVPVHARARSSASAPFPAWPCA